MTKMRKGIAAIALSTVAIASGAAGVLSLKPTAARAAENDAVNPIAKYEFKDADNIGKDSMGNYDMTFRNEWMAGGTGPLFNEFELVDGGGVKFNKKFCIAQDLTGDNNMFTKMDKTKGFTLCFELKSDAALAGFWSSYIGVGHYAWGNDYLMVGSAADGQKHVGLTASNGQLTGFWEQAWLTYGENDATDYNKFVITVLPGSSLVAYTNGARVTIDDGKAQIPADWWPDDGTCSFSIGAGFNGCAGYASAGEIRNVEVYDFAMNSICVDLYNQNGKLTEGDLAGTASVESYNVNFGESGATTERLNNKMSLSDMKAKLNPATADLTLTDGTQLSAPITWTEVREAEGVYTAWGTIKASEMGHYDINQSITYTLDVKTVNIGEVAFPGDKVSENTLTSDMSKEEILAALNKATVPVDFSGEDRQDVEITFDKIEKVFGVYYAYANVTLNGQLLGSVQIILPVSEGTEQGTELKPLANWEFEDPENTGKDSMGKYNLVPASREGGDRNNLRGAGVIDNGKLYVNGDDCLALLDNNDISEDITNGFTLNFQYQQDGTYQNGINNEEWASPVGFGFNDWSASKYCRFSVASKNYGQNLRFNAHKVTVGPESGKIEAFWGPVVVANSAERLHNVTLSVRPGAFMNVYVDGALAYTEVCPEDWDLKDGNMVFAIGGECIWGNAYDLFKGWIDNVTVYNFATTLEQSNNYWEKGKLYAEDMNGEVVTSIAANAKFEGEMTSGKLSDRITDTQAVRRMNPAKVDAMFENGNAVELNITWKRLVKENDKWYMIGVVDPSNIGYATLLTDEQEVKQEVTVERIARAVTAKTAENGTIALSATEGYLGDVITITLTPAKGYEADTVTVNGEAISANEAGAYTFTIEGMDDFEVAATFKQLPKKGCGGSLVGSGIGLGAMLAVGAVFAVVYTKRKENN